MACCSPLDIEQEYNRSYLSNENTNLNVLPERNHDIPHYFHSTTALKFNNQYFKNIFLVIAFLTFVMVFNSFI